MPNGTASSPGMPILLAEFSAARSEITTLLSQQGQFLNFGVVLLGLAITAAGRWPESFAGYLRLLPLPFCILGVLYADVTARVLRAARYIELGLRPQVEQLAGSQCLGWETYIRGKEPGRGMMSVLDCLRYVFFLAPSIGFTAQAAARHGLGDAWVLFDLGAVAGTIAVLLFVSIHLSRKVTTR